MKRADASRAHALLTRLSARLHGPLRRAYNNALATMVARADFGQVEALLARGDVGAAVTTLLDAGRVPAQSILRAQFGAMLDAGSSITLRTGANVIVGKHFSNIVAGSPRAAAAMQRLQLQFFPQIFDDAAKVLRKAWTAGLHAGANPRVVARGARSLVGLTEYDYGIIGSFNFALESGDFDRVLQRTLRDRKYDKLLLRARRDGRSLTQAEIAPQLQRYSERLQKWRAETWTRSASLNAARESQLVAWQEAADAAKLDPTEVVKTWRTMMDGRERPEHAAANGITVPMDAEFPVDGGVQTPGEGVFNCRCTFTVRVVPRNAKAREKFFAQRPLVEALDDKYIYPPHILTPEQRKAYRATQRKIAKKGGGIVAPAPAPKPTPAPAPAPRPKTPLERAEAELDTLHRLPFAGSGVEISEEIDRRIGDVISVRAAQRAWRELEASRYSARVIEIGTSPSLLHRTTDVFDRSLIERQLSKIARDGKSLSMGKPVVVRLQNREYIHSGHEELLARNLLGERTTQVHYIDLDRAQDALLRGAPLDAAIQTGLTSVRWEPPIAPPLPPKPEPAPTPGGKIVYPPGMTDPEERKRYRAKLRRMAKQGGIVTPMPKNTVFTAPKPKGYIAKETPGSWRADGTWVRTREPIEPLNSTTSWGGRSQEWHTWKAKHDAWIVHNEFHERFAQVTYAKELRAQGLRLEVGPRSLGRNSYGHYSPNAYGGSEIAIKKDISLFMNGTSVRDVDMVKEVAYHETGHAVDYQIWGGKGLYGSYAPWSSTNEFLGAFSADKRQLSLSGTVSKRGYANSSMLAQNWIDLVLNTYSYEDGGSLRRELVADIFCILHGGEVRQGNIAGNAVLAQFPRVTALMKQKLGMK